MASARIPRDPEACPIRGTSSSPDVRAAARPAGDEPMLVLALGPGMRLSRIPEDRTPLRLSLELLAPEPAAQAREVPRR